MSDLQQKFNALLKVNEQLLEANKELAAALEKKDELIKQMRLALDGDSWNIRAEILSIQPNADLVRKIKADAVRKAADLQWRSAMSTCQKARINPSMRNDLFFGIAELRSYADRIEKGEVWNVQIPQGYNIGANRINWPSDEKMQDVMASVPHDANLYQYARAIEAAAENETRK